jgi:two-component system, OmpR family, osmolarity sensor histidine kinase EnvZ
LGARAAGNALLERMNALAPWGEIQALLDSAYPAAVGRPSHPPLVLFKMVRLELEMSGLSPEARAGMEGDLAQMEGIVHQFMDLARPGTARSEPFDLIAVINAAVGRYHNETETRGQVQYIASKTEGTLSCVGDAAAIDRALTNLIENGLRYAATPAQGAQITVRCGKTQTTCWVSVKDNGPGVAAEKLAGLTQPFVRGEAARTDATGAGLGLAIVERIARQHGGQLRLDSALGQGFCATIELPLSGQAH